MLIKHTLEFNVLQPIVEAGRHQVTVLIAQVETVALAIAEDLAILAGTSFHPLVVAELLKTVLPHIPKTVTVDVALAVIAANAQATRDAAIGTHAGHGESRLAIEEIIADKPLVGTQKSVTGITDADFPLDACGNDEVEQFAELFIGEQQARITGSTPHRVDGKAAPMGDASLDEQLLDFIHSGQIATVYAGNHVPCEVGDGLHCLYCPQGGIKAGAGIPEPIVLLAHAVHIDGQGSDAGLSHLAGDGAVQDEAIGDQSPHEAALTYGPAAVHQVGTNQRLPTHRLDHHLLGVTMRRHLVQDRQEVGKRHIGYRRFLETVTAAMPARHVTAQGALPKQVPQGVLPPEALDDVASNLQLLLLMNVHDRYDLDSNDIPIDGMKR